MEKNSKIILNVASALLRVWRKYWFQKNDGNLCNILNHLFRDHILKVHNLRKHTDISDMKYRCSICPYATIENAALKKHIRFKHTHDVRNLFLFKLKSPFRNVNLHRLSDFRDHFYAIFVDSVHILKVLWKDISKVNTQIGVCLPWNTSNVWITFRSWSE